MVTRLGLGRDAEVQFQARVLGLGLPVWTLKLTVLRGANG